jgi:hypothetical protein
LAARQQGFFVDTASALTDSAMPTGEQPPGPASVHACQQRFGKISRRTRDLWQHPLLQQNTPSRLRSFGEQALALSRNVCDELLTTIGQFTADGQLPDCGTLEDLLTANEALLDWLTDRLHAADVFRPLAGRLDQTIHRIVHGEETSFSSLRSLTAELTAAVRHCPALSLQNAADVAVLPELFGFSEPQRQSRLMPSLLSALLLTRHKAHEETQRRLVTAALVQDIGAVVQSTAETRLLPTHSSTGAAMLAGLSNVPAEISLLVGSHHERLDGSGFPQRLSGARLSTSAQQLAWHVRFVELTLDARTLTATIETGESLDVLAGVRLWQGVERGAFDRSLTIDSLNSVRAGLGKDVADKYPELHRRFIKRSPLNNSQTAPWRLDDATATASPLAPRFLRRRPSSAKSASEREAMP